MSRTVGEFAITSRHVSFIQGDVVHRVFMHTCTACCTCIQYAVHYMYTICTLYVHIFMVHTAALKTSIYLLQFCILVYQLIKYHCRELSKNSLTHHSPGRPSGGGGGGLRGSTRGGDGKGLRGLIEVFPPDWRGRAIDLILKET